MAEEWLEWENRRPPSPRARTTLIGGHFPPEVAQQLALIAARERKTKKALLKEALDLLFASREPARVDTPRDEAPKKPKRKDKKNKRDKAKKKAKGGERSATA